MEAKNNTPRRSLSLTFTFLIVFVGLGVVVLLISQSLQLILSARSEQAGLSSRQRLIAEQAGREVANFIQLKFTVLETAVELTGTTASREEQQSALAGLLALEPAFRQIAFLDSTGQPVASSSRRSLSLSAQFEAHLTEDVLAQTRAGQRYIGPVYIGDLTNGPQVLIAVPMQNILGDIRGALVAEVNLNVMWDLIRQLKVGETGYAYIVDNQGNLIAARDTALVVRGENVKENPQVKEFLKDPWYQVSDIAPELESYKGLLGEDVVGTYVPLVTPVWAVIIELPTREAYQPIIRALVTSVASILIFGILVGLVGNFLARRLSAPLIELSSVATEISSGNLGLQAKVSGPTEIAKVASTFNMMTSRLRETLDGLERIVAARTADLQSANERNERRARQFESIARVARTISSTRDLDILLTQTTTIISHEFGFYHAGVFLLDAAKEYAVLRAANSEGGQLMLDRGHRLKVGETSIVGYVMKTGKPRIASDIDLDSTFHENPDLPHTRSEIALPLRAGDEIIGALDVQSTALHVFSHEDMSILSTLADQVSIAIQNAQQFEQTRQALKASEELANQFVQTGWQQFTRNEDLIGVRHTGAKSILLHKKDGRQKGEVLPDQDQPRKKSRGASLALPIKLRGEVIGAVDIRTPDNRPWDPDELDIATAIIERAAISMENARLLQESQRLASKEAKIGEVTAKISSSINMRRVLQTAVEELGHALPGSEIVIQFQTDQDRNKATP